MHCVLILSLLLLKPSAFTCLLQAVILVHETFCHHYSHPIIRVCISCAQIVIQMIISLQLEPNGIFIYIFINIFTPKLQHLHSKYWHLLRKCNANCGLIVVTYIAYSYSGHMPHQNHVQVFIYTYVIQIEYTIVLLKNTLKLSHAVLEVPSREFSLVCRDQLCKYNMKSTLEGHLADFEYIYIFFFLNIQCVLLLR